MAAENQPAGEAGRIFWLTAGLIFLLGSFLRLFRVGDQIILDDEWHALNVVQDQDYGWIFSHLGHADHSIPLALLYEFFSHSIGLSELSMRAPSLLAGLIAIAALPYLWRHWLSPREGLVMAALIAISPFLVNFSRIARPYMLLTLLAGSALIFAWRWWKALQLGSRPRQNGSAWIACTVLAGWFNPVSLAVTCGPFLWFGFSALKSAYQRKNFQPLLRLTRVGLAITALLALLFFSPLSGDLSSLAVKSGMHWVTLETFYELADLYTGSGYLAVIVVMLTAVATGWLLLLQRDREFALYMLLIALAATLAVAVTGAEWIFHGLVLARYLIGLLPVFLALAAMGLLRACDALTEITALPPAAANVGVALLITALFLSGPLPELAVGNSQFVHHLSNQFDFDKEANPFREALEPVNPEPFYAEIAKLHPEGDAVVVEAPWYLESHWNALPIYQAVHGQHVLVGFVGGTCADRLYGELRQDVDGLEFRHFVSLHAVLAGEVKANYLVLRKDHPKDARIIEMDYPKCEQAARAALGPPWRETETALVFRLPGDS